MDPANKSRFLPVVSAYLAGALTVTAAVVSSGARPAAFLALGCVLGLATVALTARLIGVRRLSRILESMADRQQQPAATAWPAAHRRRQTRPRSAPRPTAPRTAPEALTPIEEQVISGLVNLGQSRANATAATIAARKEAPQQLEPLFKAAARMVAA